MKLMLQVTVRPTASGTVYTRSLATWTYSGRVLYRVLVSLRGLKNSAWF